MKRTDLTNKVFGEWTAIKYAGNCKWLCRCKCGVEKVVSTSNLTLGLSTKCRSCGPLKAWGHNRLPKGTAALNDLINRYVASAKVRGLVWGLSREEALSLFICDCNYCGISPNSVWPKRRTDLNGSFMYNGIDRRDNTKGYILENCIPCCGKCNYMKRDLTEESFLSHINAIARFMKTEEIL